MCRMKWPGSLLDQRWGIEELKPMDMSLEDIFLKLTTEEKEVKEAQV